MHNNNRFIALTRSTLLLLLTLLGISLIGRTTDIQISLSADGVSLLLDHSPAAELAHPTDLALRSVTLSVIGQIPHPLHDNPEIQDLTVDIGNPEKPAACTQSTPGEARCTWEGAVRTLRMDLSCKGCTSITLRGFNDSGEALHVFSRPWYHYDCGVVLREKTGDHASGCKGLRPSIGSSLLMIVAEFRGSLLFAVIITILIHAIGLFLPQSNPNDALGPQRISLREGALLTSAFVVTVTGLLHITITFLEGIPHVQDSMVYWIQGAWLANGHLSLPPPPCARLFEFPFMYLQAERWFSQYPVGWPLLLALGHLVNSPEMIPALCGGTLAVAVYLLGRTYGGRGVGTIATLLLILSPWFQMTSSNFMSHGASALFTTLCVLLWERAVRTTSRVGAFSAGLAGGYLLLCRPLTAGALAVALLIRELCRFSCSRWHLYCLGLTGASCGVGGLLLVNYLIMGDPMRFAYELNPSSFGLAHAFRYWSSEYFPRTVADLGALLSLYRFVALPLPAEIVFGPALLGLMFVERRITSLPILILLAIPIAYSSILITGSVMYGPRYWYESLPLLCVLSALGLCACWERVRGLQPMAAQLLRMVGVVSLLAVVFLHLRGWFLSEPRELDPNTPLSIASLRNFNGINKEAIERALSIEPPAILMVEDSESGWHPYGRLVLLNKAPITSSDYVVTRKPNEEEIACLRSHFPEHSMYRVTSHPWQSELFLDRNYRE